jgi:ABC-2 type transport system permease protein
MPIAAGLLNHLLITVRLNLRSRQAMVYGYLVPLFFLIGFASVFRWDRPRLSGEMGMLLTITVLGGACFGMPTAMVAERERGVWRRYRLLPAATGAIVFSTMVARFFIVASAVIMQILLAKWIYDTPFPKYPLQLAIAFFFVAFAFEGLGLVIAMLADTVPAVQALGQSIFLPMILIGGVGVPLRLLPPWAQWVAGFLPGRYAVHAMQACFDGGAGLPDAGFDLLAMLAIGLAACVAGAKLFRWDSGQKISGGSKAWVCVALAAWAGVGLAAGASGKLAPLAPPQSPPSATWQSITDSDAQAVTYDDLQSDDSDVTPLVNNLQDVSPDDRKFIADFGPRLTAWGPGQIADPEQRVRNLMSLAAVADIARDEHEAEIPYVVFQQLKSQMPNEELVQVLTWIIRNPDRGTVLTTAPEFGIVQAVDESEVRSRTVQYSKKLLGRLVGKISGG